MYVVRFSYEILPKDREAALRLIQREVEGARAQGLQARLLVPLTRGHGGSGLQYEVEMDTLAKFDNFRANALGSEQETGDWMREFSALLTAPPIVEILRISE